MMQLSNTSSASLYRELPTGVLDDLSPEQVLQCNTEEESVELVKLLLPTQSALLNRAVELMVDVAEEEEAYKMNARNIAMSACIWSAQAILKLWAEVNKLPLLMRPEYLAAMDVVCMRSG
ncbi:hypothetical protein ACLOJK_012404 [Asimina triloba]